MQPAVPTSAMLKPAVYRIQDIPSSLSDEDLRQVILERLEEDEPADMIQDLCLFPHYQSQITARIALVKLKQTPRFLFSLVDKHPSQHSFIPIRRPITLKVDRNFVGFSQVNLPNETQGIAADIIAISGIGGHAYGSWRHSEADFMWIQGGLPSEFPRCRVMLYGYESKLSSRSTNRLSDYCMDLREELSKARQTEEERSRPIIFIAHSFGGIIVANTLIQAQTDVDRSLYNAIEGFLFFGTPHKGLIIDEIRAMLKDPSHPRHKLLDQIDDGNEFLGDQLHTFKNVLKDRQVVSFYETKQTRQLEEAKNGEWYRTGPHMELSDRDGSLLGLPDAQERKVPVNEDHSGMVKLDSPTNSAYLSVVKYLKEFLTPAQGKVLQRNDPTYNPRELMGWLSSIDSQSWEGMELKPRDVPLNDAFLSSVEFSFWEKKMVKQLECYGSVGSGKTYLAYHASQRLRQTKTNCCIVSTYIQPMDRSMTVEKLLGAMLKQLLRGRKELVISTMLTLYHKEASSDKQQPQTEHLRAFIETEIHAYDYVYFIVDGFDSAKNSVQGALLSAFEYLWERTDNIGVLFFKREDGGIPTIVPFCDDCGEVSRVHYRCEQCSSDTPFDLCPSCERKDKSLRCHPSHSFSVDPVVVTTLPARIEEMKLFIGSMIDNLIQHAGSSQSGPGTGIKRRRVVADRPLTRMCVEDPGLRSGIVDSISMKLWGINFTAAREWFESLKRQSTAREVKEMIASIPWRGNPSYGTDLEHLQKDDDFVEGQLGWKIVSLVAAAQRILRQEDLRTALAALTINPLASRGVEEDSKMDLRDMLFLSKGLITVIRDPDGDVRPDPTFINFLRRSKDNLHDAHCNMAEACLNYLGLQSLLDSSRYKTDKEFWEEHFLSYATCSWGDHVRFAGQVAESKAREFLLDDSRIEAFIRCSWVSNLRQEDPPQWDVSSGVHALHVCAWFGLASLIPMVQGRRSIDEPEMAYEQTPLMYACRKGHKDTVLALLDAGADPARFSTKGYNALFEAVTVPETSQMRPGTEVVRILLDDGRVDIDATHSKSKHRTALHIAIRKGNAAVAEELLVRGADPNAIDARGWTPLMYAARQRKPEEVERLLRAPIDVDLFGSQWRFGTTALHLAVENGDEHTAVTLLSENADPKLKDIWGLDVEAKARRKGLKRVVCMIVGHDAEGSASESVDETHATSSGTHELHSAVVDGQLSRVEDIIKERPSLAQTEDQCGRTPLHLAANNFNKNSDIARQATQSAHTLAKLLIPHSDLSVADKWGLTAMDYAIYNRSAILQVDLLDAGAEFDAELSDELDNLLSIAFRNRMVNAMHALFEHGADELQAYPLIVRKQIPSSSIDDLRQYRNSISATKQSPLPMASGTTSQTASHSLKGQGIKRSDP